TAPMVVGSVAGSRHLRCGPAQAKRARSQRESTAGTTSAGVGRRVNEIAADLAHCQRRGRASPVARPRPDAVAVVTVSESDVQVRARGGPYERAARAALDGDPSPTAFCAATA